jgi:hypothetical protein
MFLGNLLRRPMATSVFALCSKRPEGGGSVVRIKVQESGPQSSPFLAFATEHVGRYYIRLLSLENECQLVRWSELSAEVRPKDGASVFIFESEQQVEAYYEDRTLFSSSRLIRRV